MLAKAHQDPQCLTRVCGLLVPRKTAQVGDRAFDLPVGDDGQDDGVGVRRSAQLRCQRCKLRLREPSLRAPPPAVDAHGSLGSYGCAASQLRTPWYLGALALLSPVAIFSPQQFPTCVYCVNGPDSPADIIEFKYVTYKLVIAGSVATAVQLVAAYESCPPS